MADPVRRPAPVSRPGRETARQRAAREERDRQDANATRRVEAEAAAQRAAADAEARKAEAQAKTAAAQAEAEVNRMRAQAEAQRIKVEADAAKRRSDAEEAARQAAEARAPVERAYQLGINVGAPVLGYVAGVQLAKNLGAKHAKGVEAANKQLKALGTQIAKAIPKTGKPTPLTIAKLSGMVSSADMLRLASRPRAIGYEAAGIILAEGMFSRFVLGPQAETVSPVAGEAVRAVGTVSIFAGSTMLAKRGLANATTAALPDAKAVAAVEAARGLLPASSAVAAPASLLQKAAAVAKAVPKSKIAAVALAAGGAAAVVAATTPGKANAAPSAPPTGQPSNLLKAAEISLTTASSVQAARLLANPALRATAGILTKVAVPLAVLSAGIGAAEGYSKTGTVTGALEGAADSLTGGGYSYVKDMVAKTMAPMSPAAAASPQLAANSVAFMRGAAARAAAEMGQASVMSPAHVAAMKASDGRTEAYTRTQNGRSVFVRGYATPTGTR